jgi:hypothetical protein
MRGKEDCTWFAVVFQNNRPGSDCRPGSRDFTVRVRDREPI